MESEASHLHKKWRKHSGHAPFSFSSSVQDSNFKSGVLPGELITEILLRLQVKHLLKFKCVSKSWLGSISSPEFVKIHLSRSANDKACHRVLLRFDSPESNLKDCSVNSLFYDRVTRTIDVDYLPKISYESIEFFGSVNGLVCVAIEKKDVFLWNPSIKKLKKLPSSETDFFYMYGFGYDELHDDYKVVIITKIVGDDTSRYTVGKIYSLNNNSWKRLDDMQNVVRSYKSGMLVNGKLHWTITNKLFSNYNDWVILVVDLADGRLEKMEIPSYGEGKFYSIPYLGVLGNELSMICQYTMTQVDVWVMKEFGVKKSWTKLFNIDNIVVYPSLGSPFCMSSEGEFLFKNGSFFTIYNPNDDSKRSPRNSNYDDLEEAQLYIESLVWPFCKTYQECNNIKGSKSSDEDDNRVLNN